tara:strand:+ start:625 stop:1032 length:408 start_codon:yes stop_codon:yes gene_type:complete
MGNYLSTDVTWYVYRRALSTDEWVSVPLQSWTGIDYQLALRRFKHETYSFALGKHVEYTDTKAIYLYNGNVRIVKALLDPETSQLEIWSTAIREWLSLEEKLAPQRYPLLETEYFSKYVKKHAWINTQTVTFVAK